MSGKGKDRFTEYAIEIEVQENVTINGDLSIVEGAKGVVLFAHGSGSSRFSLRNRFVAAVLQRKRLSTLLIDLLTKNEEQIDLYTRKLRFDIPLLTSRVIAGTQWLQAGEQTKNFRIGYFGASTGAAATLAAAAGLGEQIFAIVSRGGRPDLAGPYLSSVKTPTLLIVGGSDFAVIDINRQAAERLQAEKKLEIIPGATHLFEEPGALRHVADLAAEWFVQHLAN